MSRMNNWTEAVGAGDLAVEFDFKAVDGGGAGFELGNRIAQFARQPLQHSANVGGMIQPRSSVEGARGIRPGHVGSVGLD